jgi:hypothetical protein
MLADGIWWSETLEDGHGRNSGDQFVASNVAVADARGHAMEVEFAGKAIEINGGFFPASHVWLAEDTRKKDGYPMVI